jgi:hypothetical protein
MGCGVPPGGRHGDEGQTRQHDQTPNIFGPKVPHEHGASFAPRAHLFFLPTESTVWRGAENGVWCAP